MSEQTCVAMQQALLAGLGHLKQNNREPLIHIGCNEAGITKVSIEDVAKYEILMVQLMRQNEVEKEIVLCALLAKWPHAKGDFHDTEAEKILMLYKHCIRLCKRKQFSNLLPINRIKAAYIATQGSWSERAQKADGTERPGVIVASSAVAGPDASIEERPGVWRGSSSLAYQDAPFASEVSSEEPPDVVAISDEETRSDAPSIVHVVDDGDEDARNRAREQLLKFPSFNDVFYSDSCADESDGADKSDTDDELYIVPSTPIRPNDGETPSTPTAAHYAAFSTSYLAPVDLVNVSEAVPVDHVQHKMMRVNERKLKRGNGKQRGKGERNGKSSTVKKRSAQSESPTTPKNKHIMQPDVSTKKAKQNPDPHNSEQNPSKRCKSSIARNPNQLPLKSKSVDYLVKHAQKGFKLEKRTEVSSAIVLEKAQRRKGVIESTVLQLRDIVVAVVVLLLWL